MHHCCGNGSMDENILKSSILPAISELSEEISRLTYLMYLYMGLDELMDNEDDKVSSPFGDGDIIYNMSTGEMYSVSLTSVDNEANNLQLTKIDNPQFIKDADDE